ncbi:uncharacterized protein MELLADRAFT_109794 [Melampsora larici-populina 98AG31]|uniref:Secreted protein n=1 Tax=Melampsora larici-populina (strain 98AG31 / pathotype 3-4-7) TaxID=747676 RepID=F4RXN4_MELLP|nr:uncharacterized protein MELLADRAFT_109794 [Melampsora larici-populina 98AG31]EGG02757.1 secreted protein [Melampsora larici-populina 98AG31]
MNSLIFLFTLLTLFCILNQSLSNDSEAIPVGHMSMFFKQIGNELHVVPRHMVEDDYEDEKEEKEPEKKPLHHTKRENDDKDPMDQGMKAGMSNGQKSSDLLANLITSTFDAIPSDQIQDKNQEDDEGKVENNVPGYKHNSITTPIGEAVVDEWAKLIGDCDHNSSIDPTATSSCKQTKSTPPSNDPTE